METLLPILVVVVLPITIVALSMSHKRKMAELEGSPKLVANLEAELVSIKKRLAILETIVTDDKYQLNQEFNKLNGTNE